MKNSQKCIKCQSNDILRIPAQSGNEGNFIYAGGFKLVKITRFICENCGYSEEWIESEEDLLKLVKKYK